MQAKFEVGRFYSTRSVCDHNCIFTIKVIKRTDKSIWILDESKEKRCKIYNDENGEYIIPDHYSMAPVYRAILN